MPVPVILDELPADHIGGYTRGCDPTGWPRSVISFRAGRWNRALVAEVQRPALGIQTSLIAACAVACHRSWK
jgi:hypothetical protein